MLASRLAATQEGSCFSSRLRRRTAQQFTLNMLDCAVVVITCQAQTRQPALQLQQLRALQRHGPWHRNPPRNLNLGLAKVQFQSWYQEGGTNSFLNPLKKIPRIFTTKSCSTRIYVQQARKKKKVKYLNSQIKWLDIRGVKKILLPKSGSLDRRFHTLSFLSESNTGNQRSTDRSWDGDPLIKLHKSQALTAAMFL